MNEQEAREILKGYFQSNRHGGQDCLRMGYSTWFLEDSTIYLDGDFTAKELQAIAWWMENKGVKKE